MYRLPSSLVNLDDLVESASGAVQDPTLFSALGSMVQGITQGIGLENLHAIQLAEAQSVSPSYETFNATQLIEESTFACEKQIQEIAESFEQEHATRLEALGELVRSALPDRHTRIQALESPSISPYVDKIREQASRSYVLPRSLVDACVPIHDAVAGTGAASGVFSPHGSVLDRFRCETDATNKTLGIASALALGNVNEFPNSALGTSLDYSRLGSIYQQTQDPFASIKDKFSDYVASISASLSIDLLSLIDSNLLDRWRRRLPSNLRNRDINRLVLRHGPEVSLSEVPALERGVSLISELLSACNWHKLNRNLSWLRALASSGSRLLKKLLWLATLTARFGRRNSVLFKAPKLIVEILRNLGYGLSPPPEQPLSRFPNLQPNAPNVAA